MSILGKLTRKSLFLNKERSITSLLAIIIAVATFTGISLMYASGMDFLVQIERERVGNFEAQIVNVQEADKEKVLKNDKIKNIVESKMYSPIFGESGLEITFPLSTDFKDFQKGRLFDNYLKGKLPEKENEILLRTNEKNYKPGDKFKINNVEYVISGIIRDIYIENLNENKDLKEIEKIDGSKINFAILRNEDAKKIENNKVLGYVYSYDFKNVKEEIIKQNDELVNSLTNSNNKVKEIHKNMLSLMDANIGDSEKGIVSTMKIIRNMLLGVVSVAALIVIYNSFNVSVAERKKQFGVLKSTGATSKQIYYMVMYEAFLYSLIGIVVGFVFGMIGIKLVQVLIGNWLTEMFKSVSAEEMKVGFNFILQTNELIVVGVTTAITVFVSAFIPAIKAGRVSAIEAIRNAQEIKIKPGKVRTSRLFKRLLGIEIDLGRKNMKRAKGKFRVTIISLAVSFILLFVMISTRFLVIDTLNSVKFAIVGKFGSRTVVANSMYNYEEEKSDSKEVKSPNFDIKKVEEEEKNVKEKMGRDYTNINYVLASKGLHLPTDKSYYQDPNNEKLKGNVTAAIYLVKGKEYSNLLKELGIEKLEDGEAILQNFYLDKKSSSIVRMPIYKSEELKKNGLSLKYAENDNAEKKEIMHINKVYINDRININSSFNPSVTNVPIVVNENTFNKIAKNTGVDLGKETFFIMSSYEINDKKEREAFAKKWNEQYSPAEQVKKENGKLVVHANSMDVTQYVGMIEATFNIVELLLYGFLILIVGISVTNIFSTIAINIILRSKEFAILESTGMTNKQIKKMIRTENTIASLKGIIFGSIVSFTILWFVYKQVMGENMDVYKFMENINVWAFLLASMLIYGITWLSSIYAVRKINKEDIVKVINNENI